MKELFLCDICLVFNQRKGQRQEGGVVYCNEWRTSSNRLSTASTGSELTSVELGLLGLNLTLDGLVLLSENDFDVAGGRHVGVDATVSTVGAATLARGLVDLDVLDNKSLLLQALDLFIRKIEVRERC